MLMAGPVLLAAQAPASPQVLAAATTERCLYVRDIQSTDAVDETVILYRMRDGTIWRNELPRRCPGLGTYPFVDAVRLSQVCANDQPLRIPQTGASCTLGEFTLVEEGSSNR
jgi:hypothetical protein